MYHLLTETQGSKVSIQEKQYTLKVWSWTNFLWISNYLLTPVLFGRADSFGFICWYFYMSASKTLPPEQFYSGAWNSVCAPHNPEKWLLKNPTSMCPSSNSKYICHKTKTMKETKKFHRATEWGSNSQWACLLSLFINIDILITRALMTFC